MPKFSFLSVTTCLYILLSIGMISSIRMGGIDLTLQQFIDVLTQQSQNPIHSFIIYEIRLPRTLLCLSVGAILALCGTTMQCLFRNSLADATIMGVSAGASLGVALTIVCFASALADMPTALNLIFLPMSAFLGSCLISFIIYQLGKEKKQTSMHIILLAGIAINAFCGAFLSYLTYIADDQMLRDFSVWTMGSLAGADSSNILLPIISSILLYSYLHKKSTHLNALLLGDVQAHYLGIHPHKLKRTLIIVCSIGIGIAVSLTGLIGFVGLVVPHITRMIVGANHQFVLPVSALLGALLLTLADIIARLIILPAELPIGIITAFIGAPFFLYLLLKNKGKNNL